ncbi:MAG: alpha/beta hydrolase [Chloroflexaceae bacterium]|nr:alpha/beta hydrolase [Chloroflexaceae bacterium]NJO05460.1 alpha/beta hydrolase [Chloroflexaceae bacterium]
METLATRHGPLAYNMLGSGTPFVLLHGNTMTGISQERLAQRFTDEHTVYSLDLLGHGQSARPANLFSEDYFTLQGQAFADWLTAMFPDSAVPVFGMSAGGVSAMNAACEQPERIAALILDSVFVYAGAETVAAHRDSVENMSKPWYAYLEKQHGADWWPTLNMGLLTLIEQLEASRRSVVPCLDQIRIPTLVFQGGQDPFARPVHGQTIAEAIPGARLVYDEETGHIFSWRDPAGFREIVRAFLREVQHGPTAT